MDRSRAEFADFGHERRETEKKAIEMLEFSRFRLSFMALEDFDPEPGDSEVEIPPEMKRVIDRQDDSAHTYEKTVQKSGWQKDIMSFAEDFIGGEGQRIGEVLGIEDIRDLSPRQAVGLTIRTVLSLTRYSRKDGKPYGDRADNKTVLELLREGQENSGRSDWEGNGVCRNFASITKALFESLKGGQRDPRKLRNLHCAYQVDCKIRRGNKRPFDNHAWNSFFSFSDGKLDLTEVDVTWGKYDPETGKVSALDQTEARIDELLRKVFVQVEPKDVVVGLDYFLRKMKFADSDKRDFFLWEVGELLRGSKGLKVEEIPSATLAAVIEELDGSRYGQLILDGLVRRDMSPEELPPAMLERIREAVRFQPDTGAFLKKSRTAKEWRQESPWKTIVTQDRRFVGLVLEELAKKDNFVRYLDENMKLRSIVRLHRPDLLPRFDPVRDRGDFNELKHLLDKAVYVKRPLKRWLRERGREGSSWDRIVRQDDYGEIVDFLRHFLRDVNPAGYDRDLSRVSGWKIISEFNDLYERLRDEVDSGR
ncbi:hypothetical protein A2480_03040 [Candidatus Uhrbacteria bacterium RIFOXYC2_FULL_47_19]|uniref:Uncharacterized protein n=1 Tax=Candidatus Uhrbacteria bacterium RIFOXYC2_FULL_47_19 TaxID=1802424 RepID=A0A1F7WDS6_9BACT|nr:MAG: hypothetical protein A2480_03040 [Candidatus Uhrbacteria bacterium RIFOXYC2_FULL_47_19]